MKETYQRLSFEVKERLRSQSSVITIREQHVHIDTTCKPHEVWKMKIIKEIKNTDQKVSTTEKS